METYTLDAILPFTIFKIYLCQFHNYHYSLYSNSNFIRDLHTKSCC